MRNYISIFTDPYYYKALGNSLIYAGLIVAGQISISLFMALFVFEMPHVVHDFVRFVFYVPVFASGIIIANVWKWIFHARYGVLNWLIGLVGIEPVSWFSGRYTAIGAISIMQVMGIMGFNVLIYLAAMLSIDKEIFDAAKMDGASWARIKRSIILPMIAPQVLFTVLLSMIGAFQIFEYIYLLTGGGPDYGSASLMFDIYDTGFGLSKYGVASAKSVVLMVIIMSIAVIKKRLEKRWG